jgi:flagellar hook-basal body complex protein FliE
MMIRVGDSIQGPVATELFDRARGIEDGAPLSGDGIGEESVGSVSFGDVLGELVAKSSEASSISREKANDLARGASDDLHGTMIAAKEAEISLKLVGTIRNKVLDAFQELWRTNV